MAHYVPLLTTLAWIALIIGLLFVFRKPLARLVLVLEDRIRGGASIRIGSFEVGQRLSSSFQGSLSLKKMAGEACGRPYDLC